MKFDKHINMNLLHAIYIYKCAKYVTILKIFAFTQDTSTFI